MEDIYINKCPNCNGTHIYYIQSTKDDTVDVYCVECNSLLAHKRINNNYKLVKTTNKE